MTSAAPVLTERQVRELLDRDVTAGNLLHLLREEHELYTGLGTSEISRVRGALLLALGGGPLPDEALPFVLEELESAHDPYLTAVAAHVLRTAEPNAAFVAPLLSALLYIRFRDDAVRLGSYGGYGPDGERTTAVAEVLRTIGWLGGAGHAALPRLRALKEERPGPATEAAIDEAIAALEGAPAAGATCCSAAEPIVEPRISRPADVAAIELEDQSGERLRFGDFFRGRPTIAVFFYTRCDNPAKCSLTIANLGRLQRALRSEGLDDVVQTAAITYDPAYDLPERLRQYARSWGATTGARHRFLRTVGDFAPLRRYFELGVNYVSASVNRHQLEAFVLDADGRIDLAVTRLRPDDDRLIERARALLRAAGPATTSGAPRVDASRRTRPTT